MKTEWSVHRVSINPILCLTKREKEGPALVCIKSSQKLNVDSHVPRIGLISFICIKSNPLLGFDFLACPI
jgi:hypothetical protein